MNGRFLAKLTATWVVAAWLLSGCKPHIGDDCEVSTDCSASGDRLCDTTQPGGYCTVFNCEPGTCPDEAVCIAYGASVASKPECADAPGSKRLLRTFCMKSCESNGDCRSGYRCIDMGRPDNEWGALVIENRSTSGKVCSVPFRGRVEVDAGSGDVCTGRFQGDAAVPVFDGGADAAPDASIEDAGSDAETDANVDADDAASDDAGGSDAGADASGG